MNGCSVTDDAVGDNGEWCKKMGSLLNGKVIGIIGLGKIGKTLVKLTKGFNFKILAFDKNLDEEFSMKYNVNYCSLKKLMAESDYISLHLDLNASTKKLIDRSLLKQMKKTSFIINTSRGELIDHKALEEAIKAGATDAVVTRVHAEGGEGGADLAKAVVNACQSHIANGRPFEPLFGPNAPIEEKILRVATNIYGAASVDFGPKALKDLKTLQSWGYGNLAVCMAKTQYSFTHEAAELGAPSGFTLPIRELRLNAGAGFVVAVCGSMMTMPGLPRIPAAENMDMDEDGNLLGMFG